MKTIDCNEVVEYSTALSVEKALNDWLDDEITLGEVFLIMDAAE